MEETLRSLETVTSLIQQTLYQTSWTPWPVAENSVRKTSQILDDLKEIQRMVQEAQEEMHIT